MKKGISISALFGFAVKPSAVVLTSRLKKKGDAATSHVVNTSPAFNKPEHRVLILFPKVC